MTPAVPRARPSVTSPGALALVLLPLLLLPLAGCAGDDAEGGSPASSESSPTSSPSSPSSPSPGSPTSPGTEEEDPSAAEDRVVAEFDDGRFDGAGYAFSVPDGWEDDPAPADQPLIGAVASDPDPQASRFGDNLNLVVNGAAPFLSPARLEKQLVRESRELTDTMRVRERTEIAGVPAVHATGTAPATQDPTIPLVFEQYAAYSGDVLYILTFTHARATPEAEKQQDVATVLGSWEWPEVDPA